MRVEDNGDGTLSILCTMIDHDGPPDPSRAEGLWRLASTHRELAANHPHRGSDSDVSGDRLDRNVELLLPLPFPT